MKPLARAKERLAPVLDVAGRRRLSLAMLEDVTRAATVLDHVWVLHSDDDAAEAAVRAGGEPRRDATPDEGLNASLAAATEAALREGATGVLIVSADCPAVTEADVRATALGEGVVLAPDRTGVGTNALWRMPPATIPTHFGGKSRQAHESVARGRGVPFAIVARPALALDVDEPRDLDALAAMGAGAATAAVLSSLGYPARAGR
ncbi:MAG TPA: 2-phospho-L-lactate guanylyltransferase [Actinomycetota bacterium]